MAFPAVSLYDTFNRANETPISNGGRWAKITGLTSTSAAGNLTTKRYAPESFTAGKETAVYWTPAEFGVIPAVAMETKEAEANAERYDSLFICLSNPTVAEKCSGYRLKWITTGVAKKVEIKVDVIEANVVTQLALTKEVLSEAGDLFGISVESGTVKAWHKTGAGAWTEVNSTANTKYTRGFVGIGGAGSNTANQPSKFEIGGTKFAELKPIEFVKNTIASAGTATAGGEFEFTGEAGQVGNRWVLALAKGSEAEAESIADSLGSSWQKDAHETQTGLRVELWSAPILSNAIPTIKVKGLGATIKVALSIAEFSGIQTSGTYVSATAGGKGSGTAVNAGTLEPAESRLAFAGFGVLAESTLTPEGGFTATTIAKEAGLSCQAMWLLKPSGSVTAKGTLSLTGVWAGEYALYKSQVLTQTIKASLNPTATKQLLGILPSEENEVAGVGESELYAYKAKSTGTITGVAVQTNSLPNPGVTSLTMGVYSDVAGKPGVVLGEATFSGEPKPNSLIRVEGLSVPVVSGTQYWIGFVNLGGQFHFYKGGLKAENQYWFRPGMTEAKLPVFTGESPWKTESQSQGAFEGYTVALSKSFKFSRTFLAKLTFNSAPIRDNFNRPNGGTGANWKIPPGYGEFVIENEQIRVHEGEGAANELWHVEQFGNNQEAYVTRAVLGEEDVVSICMSYLPESEGGTQNNNEWYYVAANKTQVELVYLEKGHVFHSLGTEAVAWKAGDVLGLRREGNKLIVFRKSEGITTQIGAAVEDNRITTGGYAGIYMLGETARMDNFGAGNLVLTKAFSLPRTFNASMSTSGSLRRQLAIAKTFSAALTTSGTLRRNTVKQIRAAIKPEAVLHRTFAFKHFIQANLSPTGSLNRNIVVGFKASLSLAGSLGRSTAIRIQALLSPQGRIEEVVTQQNNTPVTKDQPGIEGRNPRYRVPPIRIRVR
jgi:hypothetical protein